MAGNQQHDAEHDSDSEYEAELEKDLRKNLKFYLKELEMLNETTEFARPIIEEILYLKSTTRNEKIQAYVDRKLKELGIEPDA
jgi:hypothetical protein